jgi:hypothetical protein
MPRPLMQLGVGDLETLFGKSKADARVLKQLENELQYRQVPRAVALLAEVQAAMYGAKPPAPSPTTSQPSPASLPHQPGLWEAPTTPAPTPAFAPIAPSRPAEPAKAPTTPAAPTTAQAAQPTMPVDDAYKLLKATTGSTWESIEQTRRQLVQQSHPTRLVSTSWERRAQALAEAKRVNAAYDALSRARCAGR